MEELNAILLNALLAKHGSMPMQRDHFWDLPLYLDAGITPIAISIPPYHFWEPPPDEGPLPDHGSDFGLFQLAEVLGMKPADLRQGRGRPLRQGSQAARRREAIPRITLERAARQAAAENILDEALFRAWSTRRTSSASRSSTASCRGQLTRALAARTSAP